MRLVLLCFLLPLLFLSGCMSSGQQTPKSALDYYNEGEELAARGHYREALEALEKVREIYESAELNMRAALKIADTHFAAEEYMEAAAAYEDFLKQHPGHPQTPRVLYQLGMSHYHQILAIDRDQTATRNAIVAFESLRNLYPDAPQAKEVPALIQFCQNHLAENELYIGSFYYKTKEYEAAINRLKSIFTEYPDFSSKDKVHFYLGQAYLENGDKTLAALQFEALLQEYPNSELAAKTEKILQKRL